MTNARVLRVTVFADHNNVGQVEIAAIADSDGRKLVQRFSFSDAHSLLDAAEKMRLVGNAMLIHAPRPAPEER